VVRGYISKIDRSVQPYGLDVCLAGCPLFVNADASSSLRLAGRGARGRPVVKRDVTENVNFLRQAAQEEI